MTCSSLFTLAPLLTLIFFLISYVFLFLKTHQAFIYFSHQSRHPSHYFFVKKVSGYAYGLYVFSSLFIFSCAYHVCVYPYSSYSSFYASSLITQKTLITPIALLTPSTFNLIFFYLLNLPQSRLFFLELNSLFLAFLQKQVSLLFLF